MVWGLGVKGLGFRGLGLRGFGWQMGFSGIDLGIDEFFM